MWAVDVQTGAAFSAGKPHLLFGHSAYPGNSPQRGWDIAADGKSFLMVDLEAPKPTPVTEMTLVQNWFEQLKRLVPTRTR